MATPATNDRDLTAKRVAGLTSADALAEFFTALDYDTDARQPLTPEAIGLTGDAAAAVREIDVLAEDEDGFFRVLFVKLRSLTAKSRNDLARVLGRTNVDHLLVLASDFGTLEFVLLDKQKREARGPAGGPRIRVVPLVFAVDRKGVGNRELRTLRRFTWTTRDGLEQFDKLRSVFEAAAFTEDYFCNHALFADHYLLTRLRDDSAWRENPGEAFQAVKKRMDDAKSQWGTKGEAVLREECFEPLFDLLGFAWERQKAADDDQTKPDYLLKNADGETISAAFTYAWDRWLDGPDHLVDEETPDENPGACVVTALEEGVADWIVVTNGRQWRLYSRHAHSRATNFYEVDLPEALVLSGDTDPNEAFRYWWLFFRAAAFQPHDATPPQCWLDRVAEGSSEYAKELGERLKDRIFKTVFPHLAKGFLEHRQNRLGIKKSPDEDELRDVFAGTLTLLYRLLFLLYAESRDLLPIREAPYHEASLKKLKQQIAERAGIAQSEAEVRIDKAFSPKETALYERLGRLFGVMDLGDAALNVPTYNGGLFITRPDDRAAADATQERELRIARFLHEHRVPDRHLALAIDLLARDEDPKTFELVFIDYKSLAVRHLGSIYEGLLEFKLKIADEDLATKTEKKREKYVPLGKAKKKRGREPQVVVKRGDVYLSNDKAERKASGSYYTPDPIVEYIVEHTVGPVLAEKLEALRPRFREAQKNFRRLLGNYERGGVPANNDGIETPREMAESQWLAAGGKERRLVEELFEFRVLDPAMGSGHFLVEAVDFVTDRLLTFLNQFPTNPVRAMLDRTRNEILAALQEQGVSVDPAKLTDVNLLKRHVLKRCAYGVDLNPMAVELAKVSLWLDAFTLGAPLSFLNHHLRCGNSLIGATIDDLRETIAPTKASAGGVRYERSMFGIDYEPLLRAIQHVLFVNRMSDATAAEVKRSASEYDSARRELSGYKVLLDLLVARYFDFDDATELLVHGGNDITHSLKAFEETLSVTDRLLVDRVAELARRPDLRFFHWEIEFPEVFYDFADAEQRQLRHKEVLAEGSAGFDAVIGNPPYVRMESIKPLKPFLKPTFTCHSDRADLFIYFYEQAVRLMRRGGRSAFIASSTWTKTKAGQALREFLQENATVSSFLDFGDLPVFPEATTYPAIMVVERTPPQPAHEVASAVVPDLEDPFLSRVLQRRRIDVPQRELDASGWSFEDRRIARLREKIREAGIPLKDYCGSPLYGIKTGLNEAFVVDMPTYERLVAEDARSKEVLKPFLEGKDLKPWRYDWRGLYLIYTHHGIDIDRYPAIKRHLATYRKRLERRATSDNHAWYELQQPQFAYVAPMSGPKVLWPQITNRPKFSVDVNGYFLNNKIYFISTSDADSAYYLLAILSSTVSWQLTTSIATPKMNGYFELISGVMERMVIPRASESDRAEVAALARRLSLELQDDRLKLTRELDERVAALFGLSAQEFDLLRRVESTAAVTAVADGA